MTRTRLLTHKIRQHLILCAEVHQTMYHPAYMTRPSAIVAASSVFGPVLGELPESVVRWMALPERITVVQVDNRVMFHWANHGQKPGDLRGDTGTYPWVAKSARAVISNPYALKLGARSGTFQLIGKVGPPSSKYSSIQFFRLLLKYVPAPDAGRPQIWLSTYSPHSQKSIRPYLKDAVIIGS